MYDEGDDDPHLYFVYLFILGVGGGRGGINVDHVILFCRQRHTAQRLATTWHFEISRM